MPTATTATSRRWTAATVVALAALVMTVLAPTAARAADAGAEAAFVAAANRERASAGLPALAVADDLVAVARTHSVRMADGGDLHHNPSLTSDVADWQRVGENVGRGPDVDVIHTAFMASPAHRANILEAGWSEVGVGVEVRDGRVWVTQVFRVPAAGPAPEPAAAPEPTPAPAPETAPEPEHVAAPEPTHEPAAAAAPDAGPPAAPHPATSGRSLVMLSRVAADDAALDAASD